MYPHRLLATSLVIKLVYRRTSLMRATKLEFPACLWTLKPFSSIAVCPTTLNMPSTAW